MAALNREEYIQRLILSEICDDFENVDQTIFRNVAEYAAKNGLVIERSDVVEALSSLIAEGLAKASVLSNGDPFRGELEGMPPIGRSLVAPLEKVYLMTRGVCPSVI
ncbi:MAG: hypothetical protein ABIZ80_16735 [Bryobacteraceae bacterium]